MSDGARCHYCRKVPCVCPEPDPDPPWRVGRKVPRHVYRGDEPIFTAPDEKIAADVVSAMNTQITLRRSCRWCGGAEVLHDQDTDHSFELNPEVVP